MSSSKMTVALLLTAGLCVACSLSAKRTRTYSPPNANPNMPLHDDSRLIKDEQNLEIRLSPEQIIRLIMQEFGLDQGNSPLVLRDSANEPIALVTHTDSTAPHTHEIVHLRSLDAPHADALMIDGRYFERIPSSGLTAEQAEHIGEAQLQSGFNANDIQIEVDDAGTFENLIVTVALPADEAEGLLVPFDSGLRFTQLVMVPAQGGSIIVTQVSGHTKGIMRWAESSGFTHFGLSVSNLPVGPIFQALSGR